MTIIQKDGEPTTPFNAWIRDVPGLDSREYSISLTDTDIWVHRFSPRVERNNGTRPLLDHIGLVEVKTHSARVPYAQRDTLDVIDKILRYATTKNGRRRPIKILDSRAGRPGCFRQVRWLGVHVIQLSNNRPDNSTIITWDGKIEIDEATLVRLLRFDLDPDYPKRELDTRRHHRRPARETHPDMLESMA